MSLQPLLWQNRSVFFIFTSVGRQVKVTAIDEKSGVEVVVMDHINQTPQVLRALALRKLARRLAKDEAKANADMTTYGEQASQSGWDDNG